MSKAIRTFIAVKIPATPPLRQIVLQLGAMGRAVKAVSAGNLHVTLKFLGDTDLELLPEIGSVVQSAAGTKPCFRPRLVGLGVFPHLARPSVVWAGMENAETLTRIAEELEAKLRPLGFARERRKFHPHLTLARVRSKPPDELKTLVTRHESTELGDVAIGAVELLQSDLRPDGPRYTVLESAELTKPQA